MPDLSVWVNNYPSCTVALPYFDENGVYQPGQSQSMSNLINGFLDAPDGAPYGNDELNVLLLLVLGNMFGREVAPESVIKIPTLTPTSGVNRCDLTSGLLQVGVV